MQVLSKATIYGLRALLFIVSQKEEQAFVSIADISKSLDISFHFLTKIFQTLTKKGILESYRGPSGGVMLKIPSNQLFLIDIVKALEGEDFFDHCILALPGCGKATPCPMHNAWSKISRQLKEEFSTTSLADLGEKTKMNGFRLSVIPF